MKSLATIEIQTYKKLTYLKEAVSSAFRQRYENIGDLIEADSFKIKFN